MLLRIALSAALAATVVLPACAQAQAATRAECEREFTPYSGQEGKDVIWVPTPDELVNRMLTMAKTTSKDFVIDLGAGDGKIAIAAARDFGARAMGIEYNSQMVKFANCLVSVAGMADRVQIVRGDIFKEDFSQATVLTMYLLPRLNLCVRHRVLAMRPGTRVTSNAFNMAEWDPDETTSVAGRIAYLWIVPARVGGSWNFSGDGGQPLTVRFDQTFQKISGNVSVGGASQPLKDETLAGDQIRFSFIDDKGVARTVSGTVRGREVAGTMRTAGGSEARITGTQTDGPTSPAWAEMAPDCGGFYQ